MKIFIILGMIIVNIFGVVGIASAVEQNNTQQYHLNKYPEIGKLFHWGMNVGQIETVLGKTLLDIGRNRYQTNLSSDGLEFDTTLVIADAGLEALVLRFYISSEKFDSFLETLKSIYGAPSAVDTSKRAMQWKDDTDDTGVIISGEKNGLYLVTVAMRLLKNQATVNGLQPGKISSLEGVELGMTKDDFLKKNTYFEAKKFPSEKGAPVDSEVYQALLTINLIPSEAFKEYVF